MDAINVVRRMRLLGFNAVRLPFSMVDLMEGTARDFRLINCPNIGRADLLRSVTRPGAIGPQGEFPLTWMHSARVNEVIQGASTKEQLSLFEHDLASNIRSISVKFHSPIPTY